MTTKIPFVNSKNYWQERYNNNGNSGAGSYGRLAQYKANILNNFVEKKFIKSVIEFGCGDGNQLALTSYNSYIGVDVSMDALNLCKTKFKNDKSKQFILSENYKLHIADLTLSLDVVYHLTEDDVYYSYLKRLFDSSKKYVIIYSSNDENLETDAKHIRHRNFITNVPNNFELINIHKNKYPWNPKDKKNTSFCDFYFFRKIA